MSVSPSSPGGSPTPGPSQIPDVQVFRIRFFEPWVRCRFEAHMSPRIRTHLSSLSSHSGKELVSSWSLLPLSRLSPWPGSPLPLQGPSGRFPHFVGHIEELRLPTPVPGHFGRPSCARYHPCARCSLLPSASAPLEAEGCVRIPSPGCFYEWRRGASQVPGEPLHQRPALGPRSGLRISPKRCVGAVDAQHEDVDPNNLNIFEAQSHSSDARCLRFAAALLSDSRKTRFRLLARLCRAGFFRLPGSIKGFRIHFLLSQASPGATCSCSCPCATSVVRVSWSCLAFRVSPSAGRCQRGAAAASGERQARNAGRSTRHAPR